MTMLFRQRNRRRWTEADDAELRARLTAGELLPAVACALDRTQMACSTRASMLGLSVRSCERPRRVGVHHREDGL